jgi:hypothetical protein
VHEARLPPILCVVLHHGRKPWQGPRSLREMIDVSGLPTVRVRGASTAEVDRRAVRVLDATALDDVFRDG